MRTRSAPIVALLVNMLALQAFAFDLQGHRGARGLRPENTLAAFSFALATGVTTLETDLAVSKDGTLVISHDPRLNPDIVRTADGRWLAERGPPIHSLTLAELKRYDIGRLNPGSAYARQFPEQRPDDGERFPTLAEVFALVKSKNRPARLNIETKITPDNAGETVDADTFARLTVEAIRNAGFAHDATIQSFDWRTLLEVRKVAPESHSLGIKVLPWTVNDPRDMTRLIDMNVDGLITDYPDRARRVMAEKGIPLP